MAVNYVEKHGSAMHLVNDDGTTILAYPTSTDIWTLGGAEPDPGPGPDPTPGTFIWPFPLSMVSSEYGPRNGRVHQGIDFGRNGITADSPIPAAGAGKVHINRYSSGFGNHVILVHPTVTGSAAIYTVYAHMIRLSAVRVGQAITRGQIIGNVGNTGNSFGNHLHYETHVGRLGWSNPGPHINPRVFMQRYG